MRQSLAGFRPEREADWKAFEALLARVEKRAPRSAVGRRAAVAAAALPLGIVVAVGGARDIARQCADRLSRIAVPARLFLSLRRTPRTDAQRIADFFLHDWPGAIRDLWRETLVSVALMLVGVGAGFRLVASDKSWFDAIIPAEPGRRPRPRRLGRAAAQHAL